MGKANVPNRDKNLFIKQQYDYKISSVLYQRKSERMILELNKEQAYKVYVWHSGIRKQARSLSRAT